MKNIELEKALWFAGMANSVESLKSLARQESNRAYFYARLLSALLEKVGPVQLFAESINSSDGQFNVEFDENFVKLYKHNLQNTASK